MILTNSFPAGRGLASTEEIRTYIDRLVQTVRQPLLVLDRNCLVLFANHRFCETFHVHPKSVEGCRVYEIGDNAWDVPALHHLLETVLPQRSTVQDFEILHEFPVLGMRDLRIDASAVPSVAGFPPLTLLSVEDVTEREETERNLQESDALYRSLFTFSPLPTWVLDRQTFRFLAVNQAAVEQYGYSEAEFLELTVHELHAPEPKERSEPEDRSYPYFSSPSVGEIRRYQKKDGTIMDVEVRRHPLQFNGREARLVVASDITERTRHKAELEQKTREIVTIWESMTDALFTVDLEWRFTYVNAQAGRLLQRSCDDLLGKILWVEFPEAVGLAFFQKEKQAMEEQIPVSFEEFFPPLDAWFEVHAYPSPLGLSVYFQDITERHRASEDLQKSLDLLKAVTEGTTDAVFVKDEESRYLMVNSAGARIMGAPAEEIIGRDDSTFFDAEMAAEIRENDRQTRECGVARTYEEFGTSGGVTRSFLATKAPYHDATGKIIGVVGISRDITPQKRLQSHLERSERLAAMGSLVGGIAHELNNPLAAISGHAQLLQHCSDPMVRQDAQIIIEMTERAARIVRSLQTFSRHGDTKERRPLPLRPMVESSLLMLQNRLRKSSVETVLDLTEPDPCPVVIPGEIEQAILSLISNAEYALRSISDNRQIRIATNRVLDSGSDWATLSVSDNGAGIPADIQNRIFDPFFTTKPQGEGTGLGLSICHGIAEKHGGQLIIASEISGGTTITLWLPLI